MTRYPTFNQVLGYHETVMAAEGQQALLMDRGKLEAALARPRASAFGEDAYPAIAQKAAVILHAVANAHPFVDGNKRAALGAMLMFLRLNDVTYDVAHDELYELVMAVAASELREVDEIAERLRRLIPDIP